MRPIFCLLFLILASCTLNPKESNEQKEQQPSIYKNGELTEAKQLLHDYISKLAFDQSKKRLILLKINTLDEVNLQNSNFEALIYVTHDCNWIVGFEEAQLSGHPFFVTEYDKNNKGQLSGIDSHGNILMKESKHNFKKGLVILVKGVASFIKRENGLAVEKIYLTREFASQEDHGLNIEVPNFFGEDMGNENTIPTLSHDHINLNTFITKSSKSFFHNSPNHSTKRKAYLEQGDIISPIKEENGFFYIEFTNATTGKTSVGWVLKTDYRTINDAPNKTGESTNGDDYTNIVTTKNDGTYTFNKLFLEKISDQEKAIIAYISMLAGTNCDYNNSGETLNCELTSNLGLGGQCSSEHKNYIKRWFNLDDKTKEQIENCYQIPGTATFQKIINTIKIKRVLNTYLVKVDFLELNVRYDVSEQVTNTFKFVLDNDKVTVL